MIQRIGKHLLQHGCQLLQAESGKGLQAGVEVQLKMVRLFAIVQMQAQLFSLTAAVLPASVKTNRTVGILNHLSVLPGQRDLK